MSKRYLFTIAHGVWKTFTPPDLNATCNDMEKLGLYHLPYPVVDLEFSFADCVRWWNTFRGEVDLSNLLSRLQQSQAEENTTTYIRLCNLSLNPEITLTATSIHRDIFGSVTATYPLTSPPNRMRQIFADLLIATLATRNIQKETHHHKLASLNIGKRRQPYTTTTYIRLPSASEMPHEGTGEGSSKRPHWRRGHIRHQAYGPNHSLHRDIWIEPIFVNRDPDWIDTRQSYTIITHSAHPSKETL